LACQAVVAGSCVCTIPEGRFGERILEAGRRHGFALDPEIRKVYLEVPRHRVGEKYFDFEAVLRVLGEATERARHSPATEGGPPRRTSRPAFAKAALDTVAERSGDTVESGVRGLPWQPDLDLVRRLPAVLREQGHRLTAVLDGDRLLTVQPGDTTNSLFGAAIDIGTTTVVAKLVNLLTGDVTAVASAINPQQSYGADVISRVQHTIHDAQGLSRLHRLIVDQINFLLGSLCEKAGISAEQIFKCTVAGNTVMQHLALEIPPRRLVFSPYTPAFQGPAMVQAKELGVALNPAGVLYFLPNLACFVGSDITSVLTTLELENCDELQLVVDIGTNGEIVLGSRRRLLCCSSPAGPAWEGATIAWGMRAARGAIERVDLVDGDLTFRTVGNTSPVGICGSGLMDLAALLLRSELLAPSGKLASPTDASPHLPEPLRKRIVADQDGIPVIRLAQADDQNWIELTQRDVRELQLAKGAVAAGVRVLMKELGAAASDIAKVYIAGAFGNHIRGQDAVETGLLPAVPVERIHFIGNAAVAGAEAILCSREARLKAERLAGRVEYIEVAGRSDFQDIFAEALLFPPS
jgi:uncharacterized 2Fe-2S/4Fe-4S cluster protein (DUF4445 family)